MLRNPILLRWLACLHCMTAGLLLMHAAIHTAPAWADATEPTADIAGAADHPLAKRYQGSFIVSYEKRAYDELNIPLSPLQPSPDAQARDGQNNRLYRPERSATAAGAVTRIAYVLPAQRSPLEVLRNYQDVILAQGGNVAFECQTDGCGGDPHRTSSGGGGKMSLMQYFLYEDNLKDRAFSNGSCALSSRMDGQRFMAAQVPQGDQTAWVTVHTYQLNTNPSCKALNGRTIALVHVAEPQARAHQMVLVQAAQMSSALDADGSVALYGIYFDTNAAQIQPASEPTLQEIAKLLSSQPQLSILVVGHTDSQGSFEHNLSLSARRAQAVRSALAAMPGIDARRMTAAGAGMMAPVASNATEEGRAKNRRVSIVRANAP